MPTYIFTTEAGENIERTMTVAEMERCRRGENYLLSGDDRRLGFVKRDIAAEHRGMSSCPGAWPLKSDGAGVHPSQIKEHQEQLKSLGISTDFTTDGRAIFRDRAHRRAHCEAIGAYDRDGGYGDAQQGARS